MKNMRLMQGDCLERLREIPDNSVDLILTDPPYGMSYQSGRQTVDRKTGAKKERYFDKIANDDSLPVEWLVEAFRALKDDSAAYIYTRWSAWAELSVAATAAGFVIKNMIVVEKSNHGMGDLKGQFAPKHELLMFAVKGRHKLDFTAGREKDVWHLPVKFTSGYKAHPNEKPLVWLTKPLEHSSDEGQTVLDPFMGSGTTGVACARAGRNFIGIELDPGYFEIARNRIQSEHDKTNQI